MFNRYRIYIGGDEKIRVYPSGYEWASQSELVVKNLPANAGDIRDGLGRSPGGGHGNPLQYACLENPHGQRSLVGYSSQGLKESDMTEAT